MKIRSNCLATVGQRRQRVQRRADDRPRTRSSTPARARVLRATSACLGSNSSVTTRPPDRRRGPVGWCCSRRACRSRAPGWRASPSPAATAACPCWADTSIAGIPAAVPASRAARQRIVLGAQHAVEHLVEGLRIRLRHATNATAHLFGVRRPAARGRPRDPSPRRRVRRTSRRTPAVRRLGVAEVVGDLVQHHQLRAAPSWCAGRAPRWWRRPSARS